MRCPLSSTRQPRQRSAKEPSRRPDMQREPGSRHGSGCRRRRHRHPTGCSGEPPSLAGRSTARVLVAARCSHLRAGHQGTLHGRRRMQYQVCGRERTEGSSGPCTQQQEQAADTWILPWSLRTPDHTPGPPISFDCFVACCLVLARCRAQPPCSLLPAARSSESDWHLAPHHVHNIILEFD